MKRSTCFTIVGVSLLAWVGCKPASQPQGQENATAPQPVEQALPSGTTGSAPAPSTTGQTK